MGARDSSVRRMGVLFVCTGNICRSPVAEAIFRELARKRGVLERFEIGSCGTGAWHVGEDADGRARAVAARYGIPMAHVARQFDARVDFGKYEWILAMDRSHMRWLSRPGNEKSRVHLIREFDPELAGVAGADLDVPDPYYGGDEGFELMYAMLVRACGGFLERTINAG